MKIKDKDKKAYVPNYDPWFASAGGRRGRIKAAYAICVGAAICALVLWGTNTHKVEEEVTPTTTTPPAAESAPPVYGPRRVTSDDVRAQLEAIDEEMKRTLSASKPFTAFGPPVADWDARRAAGARPRHPRVLLVTSSHPAVCENKRGDQMLLKSIKNKMDYCRLHGIEIYYNMDKMDGEMTGWWVKVFLTHMLMREHPDVEWILWMDSDAVFTDMSFELLLDKYAGHNMVMHGWEDAVYERRSWLGLNTGVYLIRNCQWSMDLLHAWAPMGPKGPVRDAAGALVSKALPDKGPNELDDQSALVYLLLTNREKWGSKVYFESSYYFQSYWVILTERYEEMMEKYKPGVYGDDRWPFVTHFCGCQLCSGSTNPEYSVDRCITQMERAINFADNQVIGKYGFRHKSLASVEVERWPQNGTTTTTAAH